MPNQRNIREQVADDQMDVDASSEFQRRLNCGSQESPRPSSASSGGAQYSALNDNESIADAASDEVMEKAAFFVKAFVKEFEKKLSQCYEEIKPGSKMKKTGKVADKCTSILNDSIPPGPLKLIVKVVSERIGSINAGKHKEMEKKFHATVVPFEDTQREILVKASLEVFQRFEQQFIQVVDVCSPSWQGGIKKLAIDAVSRAKNYISNSDKIEEFSVNLITKGIILGESKNSFPISYSKYQMEDKEFYETLSTSKLYGKTSVKMGDNILEKHSCTEKYGYRPSFPWELEEPNISGKRYVFNELTEEEYVYILNDEKKEKLAHLILKEINEQNLVKKKDIEDIKGHLKKQDEDGRQFSYCFGKTPENFIERKGVLKELIRRLTSVSQELKMSRVVLVSGDSGIGKSELVRNCGFSQRHFGAWTKIIWIDASSYNNLSNSFRGLAERLGIPGKSGQKKNIRSIIKSIYEYFRDTKSLFVFDDASSYKEIENFLPSSFSIFSNREKLFVLITSSSKNWKEEIEDIEEIKLGNFTIEEAKEFTRKALGKEGLHDKSVSELVEELNSFPLGLKTAISYIIKERLSIKEYLEEYRVKQQSKPNFLKTQVVNQEFFKALKVCIDKIKEEKNVGQQAYVILVFMAYLGPNQIDTQEIFLKEKSKEHQQKVFDALDL